MNNPIYICQQERTQELNDRIHERNIPNQTMNTVYDPRPSETRRVVFPALDMRHKSSIPIQDTGYYSQKQIFNPGTNAPYSGYAHAVDLESSLQNIHMSKQKYCVQSQYIPSTTSDLYSTIGGFTHNTKQTHPLLFQQETFEKTQPEEHLTELGYNKFNNHTRQQLKDGSF